MLYGVMLVWLFVSLTTGCAVSEPKNTIEAKKVSYINSIGTLPLDEVKPYVDFSFKKPTIIPYKYEQELAFLNSDTPNIQTLIITYTEKELKKDFSVVISNEKELNLPTRAKGGSNEPVKLANGSEAWVVILDSSKIKWRDGDLNYEIVAYQQNETKIEPLLSEEELIEIANSFK